MARRLLILGGTTEGAALARAVAAQGIDATVSLAGRVARPAPLPLPVRIGGFGGPEGLAAHIRAQKISHVIDATHPFAATMSANAVLACNHTGAALLALTRAPWRAEHGDRWTVVPDMQGAVAALAGPARRVMLAVGRMHLAEFAAEPQHHYLLRLVDAPPAPPLPDCRVIVARGPFREADDRALMLQERIDLVVSKNSGGTGAVAKITAARALGLPVIMIARPAIPARAQVHSLEGAMDWLGHASGPGVERGV
jgi:precorrin-6A/cobalt-precorrin-6A reductase